MKKQIKKKPCCKKTTCCCAGKKKKVKKGFTLIEMMVVIIIIGILSAFIIMSVIGVRQKASATRAVSEMNEIKKIVDMANAEGCNELNFAAFDDGIKISCATTGMTKDYTTVKTSPNGINYKLQLDGGVNEKWTSTGGGAWTPGTGCSSGCTLTLSSNPIYTFEASGFTSGTYSCTSLANGTNSCGCSVSGGCASD